MSSSELASGVRQVGKLECRPSSICPLGMIDALRCIIDSPRHPLQSTVPPMALVSADLAEESCLGEARRC